MGRGRMASAAPPSAGAWNRIDAGPLSVLASTFAGIVVDDRDTVASRLLGKTGANAAWKVYKRSQLILIVVWIVSGVLSLDQLYGFKLCPAVPLSLLNCFGCWLRWRLCFLLT